MIVSILILKILTVVYISVSTLFFVGLFFRRQGKNHIRYTVSVVVAARNEEKNVRKLLSDLVHQTYPRELLEIVVVNDGSGDQTEHIVSEMSAQHENIHLITIKKVPQGYSPKKYALHTGVKNSKADIILTADADCRIKSTWVETMATYFAPKVGMVVGFSQLGRKHKKQNVLEKLQAFDFLQLMAAAAGSCSLGYPLAASGQNLGFRRKVFEKTGGYDKIAHRISGDDVLLLQLIRRLRDWRIVFAYDQRAFNTSQPQKTLRGLLHQRTRWASNASYQIRLNKPFFIYLAVVFLVNSGLFFGFAAATIVNGIVADLLRCFAIKIAAEFLVAFHACRIFYRFDLLPFFPVWAIAEIPYVLFAGIFGAFGKFSWKDRDHRAELKNKNSEN